jgi:hypothetical protein
MLCLLTAAAAALALTQSAELTFDRAGLVLAERDGMTVVTLGRNVSTWETGAPALPVAVAQFVVPQGMRATAVSVTALEGETLPGSYDVYPVQPPVTLSETEPPAFVAPDARFYGLPAYPEAVTTLGHQGSMFGYNIASVFVAPVQHQGANKTLVFHPRVRFELTLEPGTAPDLRPGNRSAEARRRVELLVRSVVLNPDDVARCAP